MAARIGTKVCSRCGPSRGPKPLAAFDRDSRSVDQYRSVCKECRKEQRLTPRQTPNSNFRQNSRQPASHDTPRRAKNGRLQARGRMLRIWSGLWLGLLFVGGFCWSSVNGTFALLETAKMVSSGVAYYIAFIAAGILTLGTVLSAHWSVIFVRFGTMIPASLMIAIFFFMQSLNITVNLTGVKKRLALAHLKEVEISNQAQRQILKELGLYYQSLINKYPPFDEQGRARTWKREHTVTVKAAQDSLTRVQEKIATLKLSGVSPKVMLDRKIVVAWLVLPELCLWTAILVFSLGPLANRAEHKTGRNKN